MGAGTCGGVGDEEAETLQGIERSLLGMDKKVITEQVNDILDEWDPIGANHFQGMRGNEYIMHVPRVIGNYLSAIPTYHFTLCRWS